MVNERSIESADGILHRRDVDLPVVVSQLQLNIELTAKRAFEVAKAASIPFRDGLVFGGIPNVKFYTCKGLLRAPERLLPLAADQCMQAYRQRVQSQVGASYFHLFIEHPLAIDYELWCTARTLVRRLLGQKGCPIVPIICDMSLGHFSTQPRRAPPPSGCFGVVVVLQGQLRVNLHRRQQVQSGREEHDKVSDSFQVVVDSRQALYVPEGYVCHESSQDEVVLLRFWFPSEGTSPIDMVQSAVVDFMHDTMDDPFAMPYTPYSTSRGEEVEANDSPMSQTIDSLQRCVGSDALIRRLEIAWAKRASAHGLEPVPPPRVDQELRDDDWVQMKNPPIQIFEDDEGALAVNGHAFSVTPHPTVLSMLNDLRRGMSTSIETLLAEYGAGMRPVLAKLYALRALDSVSE